MSFFSLCYRWNRFWLRRRRKRWGAVRGFESRLFWRRLLLAGRMGSRGWYGLGPRVRTCRGCGGGRGRLEPGWSWRSLFRELNRHLLVSLVGFGHVEGSFCFGRRKRKNRGIIKKPLDTTRIRKGLWCKTVGIISGFLYHHYSVLTLKEGSPTFVRLTVGKDCCAEMIFCQKTNLEHRNVQCWWRCTLFQHYNYFSKLWC